MPLALYYGANCFRVYFLVGLIKYLVTLLGAGLEPRVTNGALVDPWDPEGYPMGTIEKYNTEPNRLQAAAYS